MMQQNTVIIQYAVPKHRERKCDTMAANSVAVRAYVCWDDAIS